MSTSAWPSLSETVLTSAPCASSHVACVWRSVWNVPSAPAAAMIRLTVCATLEGSMYAPVLVTSGALEPRAGSDARWRSITARSSAVTATLRDLLPLVKSWRTEPMPLAVTTVPPTWRIMRSPHTSHGRTAHASPQRRPMLSPRYAAKAAALTAVLPSSSASAMAALTAAIWPASNAAASVGAALGGVA